MAAAFPELLHLLALKLSIGVKTIYWRQDYLLALRLSIGVKTIYWRQDYLLTLRLSIGVKTIYSWRSLFLKKSPLKSQRALC
jgi:hypothetical protein